MRRGQGGEETDMKSNMKRIISGILVLFMVLQLGTALAGGFYNSPLKSANREMEAEEALELEAFDSVDLALKYFQEGLPRDYVWPGKLIGDPEKTGFHFIPVGHPLCAQQHEFFAEGLLYFMSDGKMNVISNKQRDGLFAYERVSGITSRTAFENFASFFVEKIVPYCYLILDQTGNAEIDALIKEMDWIYETEVSGGPAAFGEERLKTDFRRLIAAMAWTETWEKDRKMNQFAYVENKHPERIRYDQERVIRILLSVTDEEQMRTFIQYFVQMLNYTVQVEEKDYLTVKLVKNERLLEYLQSPPLVPNK